MRAREIYICTTCSVQKEEIEFHHRYNRRNGDGRHSICKDCRRVWQKQYDHDRNQKVRLQVIDYYSEGLNKCNCCGESNIRFLCIDHKRSDGAEHRKKIGTNIFRWLIKENYPESYQVLCFNCNCGRAYNNGVCPHMEA